MAVDVSTMREQWSRHGQNLEIEITHFGLHAVVTSKEVYSQSGVVGIETVRLILALSAMDNALQVMAADVSNAFLYGKNIERTMIKAAPEFGDLQRQYLIVEGGWYGQ
jgi:hypothetical protein